jgi:endoglucanase
VVQNFVQTWEYFKPLRDQTFVDQKQRYVDLHRPDGTPDILQFIEHGTLNLVAQAEIIGHMAQTLSNSVLDNYHHLGDAASITDGLPYNPNLGPYEVAPDGRRAELRMICGHLQAAIPTSISGQQPCLLQQAGR